MQECSSTKETGHAFGQASNIGLESCLTLRKGLQLAELWLSLLHDGTVPALSELPCGLGDTCKHSAQRRQGQLLSTSSSLSSMLDYWQLFNVNLLFSSFYRYFQPGEGEERHPGQLCKTRLKNNELFSPSRVPGPAGPQGMLGGLSCCWCSKANKQVRLPATGSSSQP